METKIQENHTGFFKKEAEVKNLIASPFPTITMSRVNYFNKRLYIQEKPFEVYSGLTGALESVKFKGNVEAKRVSKWRDKMIDHLGGVQEQKDYLNSMAEFGTIVHEAIVRMWKNGSLNWTEEQDYAYEYFRQSSIQNNIQPNDVVIRQQVFEYCKNCAAIMMFLFNEVSEIYAVEAMAKTDIYHIATPVDLVVELKDNRIVTINVKTSNSITSSQKEQVAIEKYMWNQTYDLQAHTTGILRPKDWRLNKVPTYEFVTLSHDEENKYQKNALARFEIALSDEESTYLNYPKEAVIFKGVSKLGETPAMETKTLEQLYKE